MRLRTLAWLAPVLLLAMCTRNPPQTRTTPSASSRPTPTTSSSPQLGKALDFGALPSLPPEGLIVTPTQFPTSRTVLVALDGAVIGYLPGNLESPPYTETPGPQVLPGPTAEENLVIAPGIPQIRRPGEEVVVLITTPALDPFELSQLRDVVSLSARRENAGAPLTPGKAFDLRDGRTFRLDDDCHAISDQVDKTYYLTCRSPPRVVTLRDGVRKDLFVVKTSGREPNLRLAWLSPDQGSMVLWAEEGTGKELQCDVLISSPPGTPPRRLLGSGFPKAIPLGWSSDGRVIVQTPGCVGEGGSSMDPNVVWSVGVGGDMRKIYEPTTSYGNAIWRAL